MVLGHCSMAFALAVAFFVQSSLGNLVCENLDKDSCAFAVSSFRKRCVLEKNVGTIGEESYSCYTSEIEADKTMDFIETDECIEACGLQRKVFGISSDSLMESHFVQKLCSTDCYTSCPNIIDLYFNLAAGEGVYLPDLCATKATNARREMVEIESSGNVALGPESSVVFFGSAVAPAPF